MSSLLDGQARGSFPETPFFPGKSFSSFSLFRARKPQGLCNQRTPASLLARILLARGFARPPKYCHPRFFTSTSPPRKAVPAPFLDPSFTPKNSLQGVTHYILSLMMRFSSCTFISSPLQVFLLERPRAPPGPSAEFATKASFFPLPSRELAPQVPSPLPRSLRQSFIPP